MCFRYLSTCSFGIKILYLEHSLFTKKASNPWENVIKKTGNKEDYFSRKLKVGAAQHSTRSIGSNPHPYNCFVVLGKLTHLSLQLSFENLKKYPYKSFLEQNKMIYIHMPDTGSIQYMNCSE